ncbi:MAG: class I SAM-dependent methyltransferase [Magnetococcales bacterium]|nr:class I SAM-dependent methyltransferase [Magnetococcales bacterium]
MKEADIRPEILLARYLELSAEDAVRCFSGVARLELDCVACGSLATQNEFEKNGFVYATCNQCGTLYQTPRPSLDAFQAFYRDSVSSCYWAEHFFPAVAEARRERIFRPRAEHLARMCAENGIEVGRLIDVGAGFGILLDEWRRLYPETDSLAIEPSSTLAAECRAKGFHVVEDIAENVVDYREYADLVVCFEVLEHVFEPVSFIKTLAGLARSGGHIFVSTLCVDGFDIQTLWETSNSIFPPHHINFMSIAGFRRLFERAGLQVVSISTPGVLDVDIVRNAYRKNPEFFSVNRFVHQLMADDGRAVAFQKFLSDNGLSSHAWIVAKKP